MVEWSADEHETGVDRRWKSERKKWMSSNMLATCLSSSRIDVEER